ncbi:MAG: lysophospholipid acyltransferase family protein [Planctomycetes bacterium]|nr:lysophospholipid acyltransferase family protein [Planctomycetota bacterium]
MMPPARRWRAARRWSRVFGPWALRAAAWLSAFLPLRAIPGLAAALGTLAYVAAGRTRRRAHEGLRLAFGEGLSPRARREIARACFINAARTAIEFRCLVRVVRRVVAAGGPPGDWAPLSRALAHGRGAICVTGHFGNWELTGTLVAQRFPTVAVGKRISPPAYNDFLIRRRRECGVETIYQDDSPRRLLRALADGMVVGVLPDQDVKALSGVFLDFFGRPALTPTGPFALARAARAPLVTMVGVRRRGGGALRMVAGEPFFVDPGKPRDAAIREAAERWSREYEALVRQHPGHWVWFHRRWKTRA